MKNLDIKSVAKEAIKIEAEAVLQIQNRINQDFEDEDNIRSPGWIRYQKRLK